jgi:hypothetical protein
MPAGHTHHGAALWFASCCSKGAVASLALPPSFYRHFVVLVSYGCKLSLVP